jgi:hypothetical protein
VRRLCRRFSERHHATRVIEREAHPTLRPHGKSKAPPFQNREEWATSKS